MLKEMSLEEICKMLLTTSNEKDLELVNLAEDLSYYNYRDLIIATVDSYGGEGRGDDYYKVYSIKSTENPTDVVNIKFSGSYTSYDGVYWENCTLVEPVKYTVIRYDAINNESVSIY